MEGDSIKEKCFDRDFTILTLEMFAESFFCTLKIELIHRHKFGTREEAKRKIFEYVEMYYNRGRAHSTLGNLSLLSMKEDDAILTSRPLICERSLAPHRI